MERPRRHVVEASVSLPRKILGQAILVISGQSRMMYQCLTPKAEGTISAKRSMPQAGDTSPHDIVASVTNWLELIIQGWSGGGAIARAVRSESVFARF